MEALLVPIGAALAVGLTATVSTALARAGIPANMIAGFHHDHLLVRRDEAERALDALRALAADD